MVKLISACYRYLFAFAVACMAVKPASALTFAIDSASGAPSDTVTLHVRVYGFTDMIGAQGTIQFDTSAVSLVSPIIVPVPEVLPGLGIASFGTNNPLYPGTITFLWEDGTLQGVSVPDSSVIFSMKFVLVGNSGQSPVSFVNVPTPFEFIDINYNTISADALIPGLIEISAGPGCVPADCDDADACTIDTCDNGQCQNTAVLCDDGDACTSDSCDAGLCVFPPVNCDDANDCTTDFCIGGGCQSTPMNCDDGDLCTNDTCLAGACDYASVLCDDGDACTTDSCDPATGCAFDPVICDDGNNCTTDACVSGICNYAPAACNDTDLCTIDTCVAGSCLNIPISCNDNNVCTVDQCVAGGCTNTPAFCDDGDVCTTDGCNPVTGCTTTPITCDDGNACTTDGCNPLTGCTTTTITCDDGDACTADGCDPLTGCTAAPITCDDGDTCTIDGCDAVSGCFYIFDTALCGIDPCDTLICNDNDPCTTDACVGSGCVYNPITCDDGNACTTDGCDPVTGCTTTPINCDDGNACTTGGCDPLTGCTATPISCDDGDACTTDGCDPLTGCTASLITCDDGDSCTIDGCDAASGCFYIFDSLLCGIDPCDTLICNDQDACTTDDCVGGVCKNIAINCDDLNQCTIDACVNGLCTYNDTCSGLRLAMDRVNGPQGTDVVLPVRVYDFIDIIGLQGTIQFDPAVASFVAIEIPSPSLLPNLTTANFGTNNAASGIITFLWDDASLNGVILPDASVIFSIRFNLVGNPGESTVTSFVNQPTPVEVTDSSFNTVIASLISGLIEIDSAGCNPPCDDFDLCTTNACVNSTCVYTPINCDDGNLCTNDGCDNGNCFHNPVTCDDGDLCTNDACQAGNCFNTPVVCVDGDPCTDDSCFAGNCVFTPIVPCFDPCDTIVCIDDLNPCTIDTCISGVCNTPINCNDGDDCTTDFCDLGVCYNTPVTCDDGDACTTDDCIGGGCEYTAVNCDDGDSCTFDFCDLGICQHNPNANCGTCQGVNCDDGNLCTTDTCINGQCFNTQINCNDQDACTTDDCVGGVCKNIAINCDDGNQCTVDACVNGACTYNDTCSGLRLAMDRVNGPQGTDVVLPVRVYDFIDIIGLQGTIQFDPAVASFVAMEIPSPSLLPNLTTANFGTNNAASGIITFLWDDASLNGVILPDASVIFSIRFNLVGNPGESTVTSFVNQPTPVEVTDSSFNTVIASLISGLIEIDSAGCNPPCDDFDLCTTNACVNSTCVYTPINCDDGNLCTNDGCDNGNCFHNPITCDDGDLCTNDACQGGNCFNTPVVCVDGDPCTDDSCFAGNCVFTPIVPCFDPCDTIVCIDDLNPCTIDTCISGVCNTPINCNDGDDCTTDFCDLGSCFNNAIICNDGDACTNDSCVGGVCKYTAINCSDGDLCTSDFCIGGVCDNVPVVCNDNDTCTVDACVNGQCVFTTTCTPGFRLQMDTVTGASGSDVVMPVSTYGFDSIIAIQGTIQFDPAVASFVQMELPSPSVLPNLTTANFGTTQASSGIITFSWDDATLAGVRLPNASMIFSIRFNLVGNSGEQTAASFMSAPTLLEFVDVNFNLVTATLNNGLIIITGGPTIATSAITPTTFCAGDALAVNFTKTGTFNPGNVFTAQLSDENGSFLNPVNIGSITDTAAASIPAAIPPGTLSGTNYRIRVVSSSPAVTGFDNGTGLTINASGPAEVTIAASHTISCSGDNVRFSATPFNGGSNPTYDWFVNGASQQVNAAVFNITTLNDGDMVHAVMTSNSACVSQPTDTSNSISITIADTLIPDVGIASSALDICDGDDVTFTASPRNGGSNPLYEWFLNDTSTGVTSETFTISTLADGDSVHVVMTSSLSCAVPASAASPVIRITVSPLVNASVTIVASDTAICSGQNVIFTATAVGGGANPSYQWKVNGVDTGSNSNVFSSTTLNDGSVVYVEMTSSESCATPRTAISNSETISVTPSVTPTASISPNSNQTCIGETVTLTAAITSGGPNPVFIWRINGVDSITTSNVFTYQPNDGDDASLILISSLTCANLDTVTSNVLVISVDSALTPTVSITATPASVCAGENITFTALPTNEGASPSYQWQVNGVDVGTNSNTYSSTALNDNNVVSVTLTSSLSCASPQTATDDFTVTIAPSATPSVLNTASPSNRVCAGTLVTFTATPANGGTTPSYQWLVNGVNAGTNSGTFSSDSLNHNDIVAVVMTSSSSCANPQTVTSNPIKMIVSSSLTPGVSITTGSTTACVGETVTFTATPVNGGLTPSYQWLVNGTVVDTNSGTFSTNALSNGDIVSVMMTSNETCAGSVPVSSNIITMTVVTNITPQVTISVNANNVCQGSTVMFTANPINGGVSPTYQWEVNGTAVSGSNNEVLLTAINNGDIVNVQMTSSYSCASPDTVPSNAISMTVGPSQPVSFTGLGIEYCVDVSAQSLTGSPLFGTFSGPGVSGATFVPFHAGVGTHYVSYSYQAAAGCTAITTKGVVIHPLPVVNFYYLDNSYCSLQQTDTLIGVPSGPGGTFSGIGITGNLFKVPAVTAGTNFPVTYTYIDSNNCKDAVTKFTTINPVITPTLIGVGKQYCENSNVINLNASPSPGLFTVDGVADNTFNPAAAGLGTHALEYTYIDINNCPNKVAETLNVNPVPLVSLANVAPVCLNAAPVALQGTPSGGVFTSNDLTGDNVVNGGVFSPNNGSPGSTYTITYTYTDANQCSNFATEDVNILTPPFVSILTDDDSTYSACLDSVLITVNVPGGTLYGAALDGFVFNPSLAGAGDHYLTYVLTNTSGCTGSDKMVIKVSKCVTGIEELGVDVAVVVYPNPSEGIFIIENLADKGGDVMLEVFSIEGRRMLKQEISNFHKGSRERLDLSGYAEGMYLVKMNFGDAMLVKRVVVSR